jgi:hypothetical protein
MRKEHLPLCFVIQEGISLKCTFGKPHLEFHGSLSVAAESSGPMTMPAGTTSRALGGASSMGGGASRDLPFATMPAIGMGESGGAASLDAGVSSMETAPGGVGEHQMQVRRAGKLAIRHNDLALRPISLIFMSVLHSTFHTTLGAICPRKLLSETEP